MLEISGLSSLVVMFSSLIGIMEKYLLIVFCCHESCLGDVISPGSCHVAHDHSLELCHHLTL